MKSNEAIFVIGHRNPDTDSICAALGYAALKRELGYNAQARRLGTLNEETKFVTKYFDVEAPLLMQDARTQLFDLNLDNPVLISQDTLVYEAWNKMSETQTRSLFVIDDNEQLCGVVSTSNLARMRWLANGELAELMKHTSLYALETTLQAKTLVHIDDFSCNGQVHVITMVNDPGRHLILKNSICICSDNAQMLHHLIEQKVAAIIITLGVDVPREIIEYANENKVAIIASHLDSMQVAKLINEAIPVKYLMTPSPIFYHDSDYVTDVMTKVTQSRYRSYPVVNDDNKVVGAISRFHLFGYNKKKFILVDHSSKLQTIKNIEDGEIVEIIDHHNIGNIETSKPIYYRNQKCGCTCTIVACLYQENRVTPTPQMAGMMMSAILSDTMNFQSKTTTPLDKEMCTWLAGIAHIDDIEAYAREMLYASISIRKAEPIEILKRDLKIYNFGRFNIGVGQTNYSNIEDIQSRFNDYKKVLDEQVEGMKLDLLVMMFTHVLADGTMFIYTGDLSYIMKDIIDTEFDEHSGYDRKIMSRKQQLIPSISSRIEMI